MKRYERKASQATKKDRGVGASRDPAWIGKPILHAKAAKAGWLARYKAEAVKLEAKKRPSRKDQERLQKLRDDIERLTPRKPARKASAPAILQNQRRSRRVPAAKKRAAPAAKKRAVLPAKKVVVPAAKKRAVPAAKKRAVPVAKKRAAKTPVRKVAVRKKTARKIPVYKRPAVAVRKRPARKVPVVKTLTPEEIVRTMKLPELSRFVIEGSKRQRELQEAQRILIAEEYTQDPDQMKAHLLDLRFEAISRGEVEIPIPRKSFNQPLSANTRVHKGQKIYVLCRVFLTDPGAILEVMVKAAHAANKLIPIPKATWLANISILVYGQKTFGSPPTAWAGKSPDAALFQVQSYASTGAQPTKLGTLDALQDLLDKAAETTKSVVWLEYLVIQQFTPLDSEEKKAWRREQARKKREQRARKKKQVRKSKKKSPTPSGAPKRPVQPKKKRVPSGRKSSSNLKPNKRKLTVFSTPKKKSKPLLKPKKVAVKRAAKKVAKKGSRKGLRKSSSSSRSKAR